MHIRQAARTRRSRPDRRCSRTLSFKAQCCPHASFASPTSCDTARGVAAVAKSLCITLNLLFLGVGVNTHRSRSAVCRFLLLRSTAPFCESPVPGIQRVTPSVRIRQYAVSCRRGKRSVYGTPCACYADRYGSRQTESDSVGTFGSGCDTVHSRRRGRVSLSLSVCVCVCVWR